MAGEGRHVILAHYHLAISQLRLGTTTRILGLEEVVPVCSLTPGAVSLPPHAGLHERKGLGGD